MSYSFIDVVQYFKNAFLASLVAAIYLFSSFNLSYSNSR